MRLNSIKLAGFKSFVEPTQFTVPGKLVGVVGPNGCGKSNIIDAVRWVLGESRAAELRGESMQDVIFSGSTLRKPGARASVELVFDNIDGRAGGQWVTYQQIAVKRTLTRDGASTYYINNLPARRRDVQDIFLGTGVGPRAYAIIGQGMIARIIEAKPDELRIFLEEAAGVSKYKERRRETENRLNDARDNLLRLEDIIRELDINLEKLKRQADMAQRFISLQAEKEEKQALIWFLQRNEAAALQAQQQLAYEETVSQIAWLTSNLQQAEANVDDARSILSLGNEAVQEAQAKLYETNAEIASYEAQLKFIVDTRKRLEAQRDSLETEHQKWQQQLKEAQTEQQEIDENYALALEQEAIANEEAAIAIEHLPVCEERVQQALTIHNRYREQLTQLEHSKQLALVAEKTANDNKHQIAQRQQRVNQEMQQLESDHLTFDASKLVAMQDELPYLKGQIEIASKQLAENEEQHHALELVHQQAVKDHQDTSMRLQHIEARHAALYDLQKSVQNKSQLGNWLGENNLAETLPLWQRLQVRQGWETAFEALLNERITARPIAELEMVLNWAQSPPPAKLAVFQNNAAVLKNNIQLDLPVNIPEQLKPCVLAISLVEVNRIEDTAVRAIIHEWLSHIYAIDELDQALAQRSYLPAGASIIVRAGHRISASSLQWYVADSTQDGVLARERQIAELERELRAQNLIVNEACAKMERAKTNWQQAFNHTRELRRDIEQLTKRVHVKEVEILTLNEAQTRYEERKAILNNNLAEICEQDKTQVDIISQTTQTISQLEAEVDELQSQFLLTSEEMKSLNAQLEQARENMRQRERLAQETAFEVRQIAQRQQDLQRSIALCEQQLAQIQSQLLNIKEDDQVAAEEKVAANLQNIIAQRVEQEQVLAALRREQDTQAANLRELDMLRLQTEKTLHPLREQLISNQLLEQESRLKVAQFEEQLAQLGEQRAIFESKLTNDLRASDLQNDLQRINRVIASLGAVNMAAPEEWQEANTRCEYLQSQVADLQEAISTLEEAIRKIDQETRQLLQATFNEVNLHFGELFPKLFGGGRAQLIMTGEEILDAGVQVQAQPPGKKNSTIHLLSGGEKALTATALVFAMFHLNPAPFCLLDEVDAPLDDANTERFVQMVKTMSAKTQFLFISHNRIAMEMAEQLIGVTMQEQGVSRIVAVDMQMANQFIQDMA